MKRTILAVALLGIVGAANATGIGNDYNYDQRTYNTPTSNANANSSATANGFGGEGGKGGSASVIGSGNSSNNNTNLNTNLNSNKNTNLQGQLQGQQQGQQQVQGQGQGQDQSQRAVAKQSQNASNNGVSNTTTVTGDTYEEKRQAPGLGVGYAPSSAPCRIAAGGGVSFPGGAVTLGGSIEDEECQMRENARMFAAIGDVATAKEALCLIERNKALKVCKAAVTAVSVSSTVEGVTVTDDPILARRNGWKLVK
jgi:hypothetical protein